jgi:hypothetical protein
LPSDLLNKAEGKERNKNQVKIFGKIPIQHGAENELIIT